MPRSIDMLNEIMKACNCRRLPVELWIKIFNYCSTVRNLHGLTRGLCYCGHLHDIVIHSPNYSFEGVIYSNELRLASLLDSDSWSNLGHSEQCRKRLFLLQRKDVTEKNSDNDSRELQLQLALVRQQLAMKDQQLAMKDQQLAIKDQEIAIKDQQVAKLEREVSYLREKLQIVTTGSVS